jgi:hypothetical protein
MKVEQGVFFQGALKRVECLALVVSQWGEKNERSSKGGVKGREGYVYCR